MRPLAHPLWAQAWRHVLPTIHTRANQRLGMAWRAQSMGSDLGRHIDVLQTGWRGHPLLTTLCNPGLLKGQAPAARNPVIGC